VADCLKVAVLMDAFGGCGATLTVAGGPWEAVLHTGWYGAPPPRTCWLQLRMELEAATIALTGAQAGGQSARLCADEVPAVGTGGAASCAPAAQACVVD
jgi:hypothetical protein